MRSPDTDKPSRARLLSAGVRAARGGWAARRARARVLGMPWGGPGFLACAGLCLALGQALGLGQGLGLVLAAPPGAPLPDESRRDFSANCLAEGCHAQKRATRWIHAPVARGACETCHVEDGPPELHRYRMTRPMDELCTVCHRLGEPRAVKHAPFAKRQCVRCHNPHGGEDKDFIPAPSLAALCGQCHDGKEHDGQVIVAVPARAAFPHEPVERGECGRCHQAHESDHEGLLVREPKLDLCTGCHLDLLPAMRATDGRGEEYRIPDPLPAGARFADVGLLQRGQVPAPPVPDSAFYYVSGPIHGSPFPEEAPADSSGPGVVQLVLVHKPITSDCGACHRAHGSDIAGMLRDAPRKLCDGCHGEKMAKRLGAARSRHGRVHEGEACGSCHAAHASRFAHLLREPSRRLCLRCHDRPIRVDLQRRIPDIQAQLAAGAVHKPAEAGCAACHRSHASPEQKLLAGSYPEGNYAAYAADTYALCFSCHERDIIEEERGLHTGFRNGERNLHYLHVRGERGRTCGTCHASHGGPVPKLVGRSAPFGPSRWPLPIAYEKTETGGSCSTGCHRRLRYDRATPASTHQGGRPDAADPGRRRP